MVEYLQPAAPDPRLIDREALIRQEPEAQAVFVKTTIDRVYSLLYRIVGHRQEAEDLTQEVYARAFRALPAFRGEAEPATWVYRIAINLGRDAISRRQAERKRDGGEFDPDRGVSSSPDPASATVARAEQEALADALGALEADWREPILLVDVEGASVEEAARALEVPVGTIKSRLHRGRAALREKLRHWRETLS